MSRTAMAERSAVDVFEYLDFRAFLGDFYAERKGEGRGFSFRAFSRRAGLKSPNYLKLVIDGARNLSPAMAERFAAACGLEGDAQRYFVDLVAFSQAAGSEERAKQYVKLTGFRRYRQAHKLDVAHAAYYSAWYMPAIRELCAAAEFRADPDWIARQLVPPISRAEAARAIETLLELGLVSRGADGRLAQTEALLSTGAETRGLHIASYHRGMMERGMAAIDLVAAAERDISSLTLCLSAGGLRLLKERVQRFRRELLELSAREQDPEQVVQLNFQLFPLTRGRTRAKS